MANFTEFLSTDMTDERTSNGSLTTAGYIRNGFAEYDWSRRIMAYSGAFVVIVGTSGGFIDILGYYYFLKLRLLFGR